MNLKHLTRTLYLLGYRVFLTLLLVNENFNNYRGPCFRYSSLIHKGQIIFSQQCVACHNFRQDGIGPQLGGLTAAVSPEWIKDFIRDPKQVIESGDERAHLLFEKYKTIMPSFGNFSDEQLHRIVSFINTKTAPDPKKTKFDPNALTNPIPEPIACLILTLGLELITTIPPSSNEGQLTRICKLDFRPDTKGLVCRGPAGKTLQAGERSAYAVPGHGQRETEVYP